MQFLSCIQHNQYYVMKAGFLSEQRKNMKKLTQIKKRKLLVLVKQFVILVFLLIFAGYYQCPIKKFLHIECPGCGMTRAVYALLRLEIKQAFQYHSLVWIPVICGGYTMFREKIYIGRHREAVLLFFFLMLFIGRWIDLIL